MSARINKEMAIIAKNPIDGITIEPIQGNLRYFNMTIVGCAGSPYEGGKYKLEMYLEQDYPMSPPKVRFLTKIYHPNIDFIGRICLDILKDMWSPAMQLQKVALSIQALMSSPNLSDPLNNQVAHHWETDAEGAIATAKEWTKKYATQ